MGVGAIMSAAVGAGSCSTASKAQPMSRIDPELLVKLHDLNMKREITNAGNANVTMEALGEMPVESGADPKPGTVDKDEKDK